MGVPSLELLSLAQLPFASKVSSLVCLRGLKFAIGTDAGVMITKAKAGELQASST